MIEIHSIFSTAIINIPPTFQKDGALGELFTIIYDGSLWPDVYLPQSAVEKFILQSHPRSHKAAHPVT